MAVGALKTLFATLQASSFLAGVTVDFGEEAIHEITAGSYVVLVPRGGPWASNGYINGVDPETVNIWQTNESCDVYITAESMVANANPIDHADAVESLRQLVLCAFQDQRCQPNTDGTPASGLYWKPVSGRWETMQDGFSRAGRAYVLTVINDISVPAIAPTGQATITSESITVNPTNVQHVA